MQPPKRVPIDRVGAWASAICAVHCLLTGVALGLLSAAGFGFLDSPLTDGLFLGVAALVGGIALWHGKKVHGSIVPAIVFGAGLAAVLVGHFAFSHDHGGKSPIGTVLSVVGALGIVAFHWINWRLQRSRKCCHEAHCSHGRAGGSS